MRASLSIWAKLIEIAEKCPVHRTLTNQIDISTILG
jgi:uncharacterized OsmC-like protein